MSDEPYNIDQDLHNADWLKNVDDLRASLPPGAAIEDYVSPTSPLAAKILGINPPRKGRKQKEAGHAN